MLSFVLMQSVLIFSGKLLFVFIYLFWLRKSQMKSMCSNNRSTVNFVDKSAFGKFMKSAHLDIDSENSINRYAHCWTQGVCFLECLPRRATCTQGAHYCVVALSSDGKRQEQLSRGGRTHANFMKPRGGAPRAFFICFCRGANSRW